MFSEIVNPYGSFIKGRRVVHWVTMNNKEWQRVVQWVTKSDNEWQQLVQRMKTSSTTSDNEWQRVTTNKNEWQQMTTSGATSYNECERMRASKSD